MKKELFKSLIALKQSEIPFDVIERDLELPINRKKIITIPGVRRCGKSTMMEIAINHLVKDGVSKERILWLGFDDERLTDLSTDEFDEIISAYMELFPHIPIKDVYMFFDEIQLVKNWEYFVLRLYKSYCKTYSCAVAMPPCSPPNWHRCCEAILWSFPPPPFLSRSFADSPAFPPPMCLSKTKHDCAWHSRSITRQVLFPKSCSQKTRVSN